MLKKIKLIQGIGNYRQSHSRSFELGKVNIFYGENRNGKSTLCDILHSLESSDPDPIIKRKSIPEAPNTPPKVELLFSDGGQNHVARFENEAWIEGEASFSKLYVFDHGFIHRNVITGQTQERQNSENVTGFILGEANALLYKNLAQQNEKLRDERRDLTAIEKSFNTHNVQEVKEYVNSFTPVKTKEQLVSELDELTDKQQQTVNVLKSIDAIRSRAILNSIANQLNYDKLFENINSILLKDLKNVHRSAQSILNRHLANHVSNPVPFKGWAAQGLGYVKDESCPFCGQELGTSEKQLISAYQEAFNTEFNNFNNSIKKALDTLRNPFSINQSKKSIEQLHEVNLNTVSLYSEPEISNSQQLQSLLGSLQNCFGEILTKYDELTAQNKIYNDFWEPILVSKYEIPYEAKQTIDFTAISNAICSFNQAIFNYWQICEQINTLLNAFKSSIDTSTLQEQINAYDTHKDSLSRQIKRLDLEPLCQSHRETQQKIILLEEQYKQHKEQLETSQSNYLGAYFDTVNGLFRQFGSNDFEIYKVANNRGKQVVYELRVKFKGKPIQPSNISMVFSESDKRALALSIFLAKIMSLPESEKSGAILVLDDPVTSFDNERITLILNKLDEIQGSIKQLILTTHYKGMASKAVKKFKQNAKSIQLKSLLSGVAIELVENTKMMSTEHDLAFDRIKAFADMVSNDNVLTELRPFFEEEIRHRYKKQLNEYGVTKEDLSVCINTLKINNVISPTLATTLNTLRDSLNTPMHEIGESALENTRAIANQILDVVYNQMTA